jgi:hypothetical protein
LLILLGFLMVKAALILKEDMKIEKAEEAKGI